MKTMSEEGARAVFGELLPAGSLYTEQDFTKQNPDTVQALTNAMVRALKWLQKASPEDVAKVIPPEACWATRPSISCVRALPRGLLKGRVDLTHWGRCAPQGAAPLRSGGKGGVTGGSDADLR